MPLLSLFQLTKVFAAGFVGYAMVVSLVSVGTAAFFPGYIKGRLDMSIELFFWMVFYYFGAFGIFVTALMVVSAWCILRLWRRRIFT